MITSKIIELTDEWQLLIDNSDGKEGVSFYVNNGSGIFRYGSDAPDNSENWGMRISAGARIIPIPTTKLYGKKNVLNDECNVIINIDE
jgi:hypothetical protein